MIGVKNLSGEKLVALYDGKKHTFEADEKVTTPLADDAARHIFGYGEADKTKALLRLGWISNGANRDEAIARLGKFQFLAVEEVKFKGEEATIELPRKVASEAPQDAVSLSAEEQEIGNTLLSKPQGKAKQFARQKK